MYKYNDETYSTLDDLIDAVEGIICAHAKLKDGYHTMLNELYGSSGGRGLWIHNNRYDVGSLFETADLIAYICGFDDYATDYITELRDMDEPTLLDELADLEIEIEAFETEATE